ncbi:hypothetical protein [Streptodolium elevatio]
MCRFLELRDAVYRDAGPELRNYLLGLGQWMRANLDWALGSHRYRTEPGAAALYRDEPTATGDLPAQLASISWWWQLDGGLPRAGRDT